MPSSLPKHLELGGKIEFGKLAMVPVSCNIYILGALGLTEHVKVPLMNLGVLGLILGSGLNSPLRINPRALNGNVAIPTFTSRLV